MASITPLCRPTEALLFDGGTSEREALTGKKRKREDSSDSIASSEPAKLQIPIPKRPKIAPPLHQHKPILTPSLRHILNKVERPDSIASSPPVALQISIPERPKIAPPLPPTKPRILPSLTQPPRRILNLDLDPSTAVSPCSKPQLTIPQQLRPDFAALLSNPVFTRDKFESILKSASSQPQPSLHQPPTPTFSSSCSAETHLSLKTNLQELEKPKASSLQISPSKPLHHAWKNVAKSQKQKPSVTSSSIPDTAPVEQIKRWTPLRLATQELHLMRAWLDPINKPDKDVIPVKDAFQFTKTFQSNAESLVFPTCSLGEPMVVKTNVVPTTLSDRTLCKEKQALAARLATPLPDSEEQALVQKKFLDTSIALSKKIGESQERRLQDLQASYQASKSEAANLASVQTMPHTVRYLGQARINPFSNAILMERLPVNLSSLIKKRVKKGMMGLSIKETQTIAKAGFEFLLGMRQKGLIHKDIKPGNLTFDPKTLTVKFFDFESLTTEDADHLDITTICYRPLEYMLSGKTSASYDIWSFGATLYCCYVGERLFRWKNEKEIQTHTGAAKNDTIAAAISLAGSPPDSMLQTKEAETHLEISEGSWKLKTPCSSHIILPTWETVEANLFKAADKKKEPKSHAILLLNLLKLMLVHEDRIHPEIALRHSFFGQVKE